MVAEIKTCSKVSIQEMKNQLTHSELQQIELKKHIHKITFVFPDVPHTISGGLKMVFEYANRLTMRGYEVRIAFDCHEGIHAKRKYIPLFLKRNFLYPLFIMHYPTWFKLNPKVKKILLKDGISDKEIPDSDVVIATAVRTAESVSRLSATKGKKLYFIQGFENWTPDWPTERVETTYRLGMKNIVVAQWLAEKVKNAGADCILIPNGIDFNAFNLDIPIRKRRNHVISMLYHVAPHKGAKYGIEALQQLKDIYPDLEAFLFGATERPAELPTWIQYTHNAQQVQLRKIYNNSSIYLCPSIAESFGLTGAEAMACGAAYVSSDYGGVHEYAEDKKNVLLSPPGDVEGLVEHVSYLFEHPEERIRLAENGNKDVQQLNWERSLDKFEEVLHS